MTKYKCECGFTDYLDQWDEAIDTEADTNTFVCPHCGRRYDDHTMVVDETPIETVPLDEYDEDQFNREAEKAACMGSEYWV